MCVSFQRNGPRLDEYALAKPAVNARLRDDEGLQDAGRNRLSEDSGSATTLQTEGASASNGSRIGSGLAMNAPPSFIGPERKLVCQFAS